jgi:plasmid stability protein
VTLQTVNLPLPSQVYQRAQQRAAKKQRSIEDELTDVVTQALAVDDELAGLPFDLAEEVKQLAFLDEQHLWVMAKRTIAQNQSERIETLIYKLHREGLTHNEQQEMQQLRQLAHRVMLLRAEAAVLLKQRGHDITSLRQSQRAK